MWDSAPGGWLETSIDTIPKAEASSILLRSVSFDQVLVGNTLFKNETLEAADDEIIGANFA